MSKKKEITLETTPAEAEAVFEERFGSGHLAAMFADQPWLKADMILYTRYELEIKEINRILDEIRAGKGAAAAYLDTTDSGKPCIDPYQRLLSVKNRERLSMQKSPQLKEILSGLAGASGSQGKYDAFDEFEDHEG